MSVRTRRPSVLFRYTLLAVSAFHLIPVFVSARAHWLHFREGSIKGPAFRAGICESTRRPLPARQRQALLEGLRRKTGLTEMRFDEDGILRLGDRTQISGGSQAARDLVFAAVDSRNSFRLENHNNSPGVGFAEIESTVDYEDEAGIKHVVWDFRFDFRDFAELRGPAEALVSFDPAMQLLHELGHSVLGLHDPVGKDDEPGDCERRINIIRGELGLPLRQNYNAQKRMAVMPGDRVQRLQAELVFVRPDGRTRNKNVYPGL
jgi:hypothetical protein